MSYYSKNKAACLKRVRAYQAKHPEYYLWMAAKHRAKRKGIPFSLKLENIKIPATCPVFGTPMSSPSVDRIQNSKGYSADNIAVISKRANRIKCDATEKEIEAILRYMRGSRRAVAR